MTKSTSSTKFETRAYWRAHGERLRTTRQALKISEQEAATVYGVTLRTYQNWERGCRQGNAMRIMDGIKAFALKYNVSCDWIVLGRRHGCDLARPGSGFSGTRLPRKIKRPQFPTGGCMVALWRFSR